MLIQTDFDNPLENDIVFEETDETQSYQDILKNSENIIKSFLYLKKIIDSSSPFVNDVINVTTIDTHIEKEQYIFSIESGKILIKNIDSTENWSIFFNDGEYVLFPFETVELPFKANTKLETMGRFSIIESEYQLGKG
jgi:hypothetical protein